MIRYTLLCDGSSDRALLPIFQWSLWQLGVRSDLIPQWADLKPLKSKPKSFSERVSKAIALYPCDILFVHRDAEAAGAPARFEEIRLATASLNVNPPHVPVVPVRMTEAWLFASEMAIRKAAGNPNGTVRMNLPSLNTVENLADPKSVLFDLLKIGSERRGRKRNCLDVQAARTLVSQYIDDFEANRVIDSFRSFEADLRSVVETHHLDRW